MKKTYFPEISFVRAIACLLVILTHVTLAYPIEHLNSPTLFTLLINQLARVGTPIFALISGLLLFNSSKNKKLNIKTFYKTRFDKIVIPYLFWTIIYLILVKLTHAQSFQMKDMMRYIFLGEGYVHLYFMVVVIQFYLLFPLITKFINRNNILVVTLITTAFTAGWYLIRNDQPFDLFLHRAFLLNWLAYFFMGGFMALHMDKVKIWCSQHFSSLSIAVLVSIILMLAEMKLPHLYQSDRVANLLFVPVFTAFFMSLFHVKANDRWKSILEYIGDRSMGIYLVHLLVIGVMGNILPASFWNPDFMFIHYILVILCTLAVTEIIVTIPKSYYVFPVSKRITINRQELIKHSFYVR
ncbi:acyltransferase [Macrococcus lamae]|nr:acyltransferase [Macrococcus lamae]